MSAPRAGHCLYAERLLLLRFCPARVSSGRRAVLCLRFKTIIPCPSHPNLDGQVKVRVEGTVPKYAQHLATRNNAAREPRKRLKSRKFGNKLADFQRRIGLV